LSLAYSAFACVDRDIGIGVFPECEEILMGLAPRLASFPVREYVIIYRVEGDDVLILHVAHGRRDLEALFGD
jgi:plasmid stabilization system protein ParE